MNLMLTGIIDEFMKNVAQRFSGMNADITAIVGDNVAQSDFPNAVILEHADLMDPQFFERSVKGAQYVLSENIIQQFKECEDVFLVNSDRFAYFPISVRERKVIYYNILSYWYNFLTSRKIDLIFFEATPHMGWDTVLYYAAKHCETRILILERTSIEDQMLLVDGVAQMESVPEGYLLSKTKRELVDLVGQDFYQTVFKDSYWLKRSKDINAGSKNSKGLRKRLRSLFDLTGEILNPGNYFRKELQSAYAYNGFVNRGRFIWFEQFRKWQVCRLSKYYRAMTQKVNFENKYIFFPLQSQPERTSIPLGGSFEYQALVIEILSKAVPADWKIYVKEHPRQFRRPSIGGIHYRDKKFYDRIRAAPNIVLVDIDEDSNKLLQHAQCVATLTGSAGWESILMGKACMVFGSPWYSGCRSCLRVHSVESCCTALGAIQRKTKDEVELDLLRFLAYYKLKFIHSTNMQIFAEKSQKSSDELASNLARALMASAEYGQGQFATTQDEKVTL